MTTRTVVPGWTNYPAEAATADGIIDGLLTFSAALLFAFGITGQISRWAVLIAVLLWMLHSRMNRRSPLRYPRVHPQRDANGRGRVAGTVMALAVLTLIVGGHPALTAAYVIGAGVLFLRAFVIAERQRDLHDNPLPARKAGW